MERTIPYTASEEIELYLRTVYSLLRSTSNVQIRTLENVHVGMNSLLHPGAQDQAPDMSAFIYSLLRLPPCIEQVNRVVLGQSVDVFARAGVGDVGSWEVIPARARRRRCFFDGEETLACITASRSDIDDIVPLLTGYQIEREKLRRLLRISPDAISLTQATQDPQSRAALAEALLMTSEDLTRLQTVWGDHFVPNLVRIASKRHRFQVRLLNGSLSEYRRATCGWWKHIENSCPKLLDRPVYFISSNTHSLINLLSGFALAYKGDLLHFLDESEDQTLAREWRDIQVENVPSSQENFLCHFAAYFAQGTRAGVPVGIPLVTRLTSPGEDKHRRAQ
ncbi:MAG: hypothetical protein ACE5GO_08015 [Anaerolineales bacterium]